MGFFRTLLLHAVALALASATCEDWCTASCLELNGNVQRECGSCADDGQNHCFPGADGYDTWQERREAYVQQQQVAVGANGQQIDAVDADAPVELTSKSMVYGETYFQVASRKRSAEGRVMGMFADVDDFEDYPLPLPQESPRHCEVHSCVLIGGDDACAEGRPECQAPRGHLRPIGEQVEAPLIVATEDVKRVDSFAFTTEYLVKHRPLLVRGGAAAVVDVAAWSDEALLTTCKLTDGRPWQVLVEKQNRITSNDRHPLMPPGFDFCQFLAAYRDPGYKNQLYLVNSVTEQGVPLLPLLGVPDILNCEALTKSIYDARLWMSLGNTTSSLHFDTHDNLLMQIDGRKEVLLWHPKESSKLYMDHFEKFGLSPINVDRVDLERFPSLANATVYLANMSAGDVLYIPDGWWHVVRSYDRNVAIAVEFAPFRAEATAWPKRVLGRESSPGVFWAEKIAIKGLMREQHLAQAPTMATRRPIQCEGSNPPRRFEELAFEEPRY